MSSCAAAQMSIFKRLYMDCTFYVGNTPIEYLDSFEHLGHVITDQLTDQADILILCTII